MSAFFAFLHHVAAFALVAAVVVEFVLIRDDLNARTVRRLQLADMIVGLSAGVVLVVGLLRVSGRAWRRASMPAPSARFAY
jgi:putative membrane protein